jgi:phosphatidylinositol alpha-mannosyltransferase
VFTNLGNPDRSYYRSRPGLMTEVEGERRAARRIWKQHLRVVRHVDVYGCLSRYAAGKLESGFGRQADITPGGVSLDRFTPAAERTAHPTLLYSGSLTEPRKGVAALVEALDIVAGKEPNVRLWLSGPGDPAALLERATERVRERVDVLPLGSPDLAAVYGTAWVTVLPSVHEAFGLSLVESLACGTPVVGTDHASLPELVQPGVGALARPDDPVSLAEACLAALELAREPDIAARCRHAAEPYDWDRAVAPHLLRLYQGG